MTRQLAPVRLGREFPKVGRRATATPATRLRWFAAAHTLRRVPADGEGLELPASTVHAKQMGQPVTACGLPTMSWPKLFGIRFPARGTDVCHICSATVAGADSDLGRGAP